MAKRKITWEDLERNPQLQLDGVMVGDEIDVPEAEEIDKDAEQQATADDDSGGSAPPPDKPRDD